MAAAGIKTRTLRAVLRRPWGAIWGFQTSTHEAEEQWDKLRAAFDRTGLFPLIVCSEHGNLLDESLVETKSPTEILDRAAKVDVAAWFAKRAEGDEYATAPDFSEDDSEVGDDGLAYFAVLDEQKDPPDIFIALLPIGRPWEAFSQIGYGGWNEYPNAEEHVAIARYWWERYGAEPVLVADDVIEMSASRPPSTPEACKALAMEQYLYTAGDLVHQGVGGFGTLARMLKNRRYWYFWWD